MNTFPASIKKGLAFVGFFVMLFAQASPLVVYAIAPINDPDLHTVYDTTLLQDSYVDQDVAGDKNTLNYGTAENIQVNSLRGKNQRVFIQANTPVLPVGAVIESVQLHMYMQSMQNYRIYSISKLNTAWTEALINWNNQPNTLGIPISVTGIAPGINTWVLFDVTADVKDILAGVSTNNGWVIKDRFESASGSTNFGIFRSREYTDQTGLCAGTPSESCKPYLEVTYRHNAGGITGNVWNDFNLNGVKDEGELPQADELIWVYNETGVITATTTSNGVYSVPNLPSGEYKVCRSTLNTTYQKFPMSGALCPGNTYGARVTVSGAMVSGPDFGVSVGGAVKVALQTNPTLTEDAFEFSLLKDAATTTSHTFFAGQREYVFGGLVAGEYSLNQTLPSWWAQGETTCISNTGESTTLSSISLASGEEVTCTVSNLKKASLSVTNYIEPVQGTYSFTLSQPGVLGEPIAFEPVVLGNGESHVFGNIIPGTYNLLEILDGAPVGETAVCIVGGQAVDPRAESLVIAPGAQIQCTYNHGEFAVIQGNVSNDLNANGVLEVSDVSIPGWTVKLFKITEEIVESIVPSEEEGGESTVTSTSMQVVTYLGSKITTGAGYVFGQLNPGIYKVCEEVQPNFTQSYPASGEDCGGSQGHFVTLAFGDVVTRHFGNWSKGQVSGIVFTDTDQDGVKDEGEAVLPNIAVSLGSQTTTTNASGEYVFTDLVPATYSISITAPTGSLYSVPASSTYSLIVESGNIYLQKNFGVYVYVAPIAPITPTPETGGNGGGNSGDSTGGTPSSKETPAPAGNGPIVGSFVGGGASSPSNPSTAGGNALGVGGIADDTAPQTAEKTPAASASTSTPTTTKNYSESVKTQVAFGTTETGSLSDSSSASSTEDVATETKETVKKENRLASVFFTGNWDNTYWLWILLLIIVSGSVYYSTRRKNK
ncbi:MAG: DNRLRE domain-containing protein [Candidatus Zambryskibacteria bacterium]|nr:DNRLRE domain-containing protein [Candidatus Zambryskibacteria bacterium]